jgi:hypothetical protein
MLAAPLFCDVLYCRSMMVLVGDARVACSRVGLVAHGVLPLLWCYRELVTLPAGSATPVVKPLPSFPLRQGDAVVSSAALPHELLLLDIQQVTCSAGSGNGGSCGRQLYCSVRLEAAGAPAGTSLAAPVRTRALPIASGGVAAWQERLIVVLPRPATGGEQALVFEVWDASASAGRGASLGSGRLAVPLKPLRHREEHAAEVSWALPAGGAMQLQLSYMLQKQWSFETAGMPQQEGWSAELSTSGGKR